MKIINSGGAEGADKAFGDIGTENGYKVIHHSFVYHKINGQGERLQHSLEELNQANEMLLKANESLKRRYPPMSQFVKRLLQRNRFQVINSDAIIAIAPLEQGSKTVKGGTGWAVQMAIDENKIVHVFDDGQTNQWHVHDGNQFYPSESKPDMKYYDSIAGIGTRNISDAGMDAIKNLLAKAG